MRLKHIFIFLPGVAALFMLTWTLPERLSAQQNPETAGRPVFTGGARMPSPAPTAALTPFDLKVMSSGFYTIKRDPKLNPSLLPIETAFSEAALFRYQTDRVKDHWQTPEMTRERMSGDCEDIALWLYAELKRFGYDNLRLVIGKYLTGEPNYHAWVTYRDPAGTEWILDPILLPKPADRSALPSTSYTPTYSFDGTQKFIHSNQH